MSPRWLSAIKWILKNILAQLLFGIHLLKLCREIDVVVCSLGSYYQIPVLISKVMNKKCVCASFGIDTEIVLANYGRCFSVIAQFFSSFIFLFADRIIVESYCLVAHPVLKRFEKKVVDGALFFDDDLKIEIPLSKREMVVGFIGRLAPEKGIREFVQAIPSVMLELNNKVKFLIIGSGKLNTEIREQIQVHNLQAYVSWFQFVNHDDIPNYLNQMRLLVIPSHFEGVPNVAIEALRTGTPILCTGVGGLPDLVQDEATGFLLENNSPPEIAKGIGRALSYLTSDTSENIVLNGFSRVTERFSFEAARSRYQKIVDF